MPNIIVQVFYSTQASDEGFNFSTTGSQIISKPRLLYEKKKTGKKKFSKSNKLKS